MAVVEEHSAAMWMLYMSEGVQNLSSPGDAHPRKAYSLTQSHDPAAREIPAARIRFIRGSSAVHIRSAAACKGPTAQAHMCECPTTRDEDPGTCT